MICIVFLEFCKVWAKCDNPPVFCKSVINKQPDKTIKTIKRAKSILNLELKLLKNVSNNKQLVISKIAVKRSIFNIEQQIFAKASTLKLMMKGIIIKPKYKLLKWCNIFAPLPENLKKINSNFTQDWNFLYHQK